MHPTSSASAPLPFRGGPVSIRNEVNFAIVPEWVLYSALSDKAVRLYAVLNRYANREGKANPSRRTLAERLGSSLRTVDRTLDELVAFGAVDVAPQFDEAGDRTANEYLVRQSGVATAVTLPRVTGDQTGGDSRDPTGGDTGDAQTREKLEPEKSIAPRHRDAVWDAFVEHLRVAPGTPKERAKWNAGAKEIRDALGYSPAQAERYAEVRIEVRRRINRFAASREYGHLKATPSAVAGHWGEFGPAVEPPPDPTPARAPEPLPTSDCPDCGEHHESLADYWAAHPDRRPSWLRAEVAS
jgi:hypothetical protein